MSFLKDLVQPKVFNLFIKRAGDEVDARLKIAEKLFKEQDLSAGRALAEALDHKIKPIKVKTIEEVVNGG